MGCVRKIWALLLCAAAFTAMIAGMPLPARAEGTIEVDYYYMEVCGSCDTEQQLIGQFGTIAREEAPDISFSARMHNTMTNAMDQAFTARCKELGITEPYNEGIFCGDLFLPGRPDEEQLRAFIRKIAVAGIAAEADKPREEATPLAEPEGFLRDSSGRAVFVYFYVTGCADCARVDEALSTLPGDVTVLRMNVGQDDNLSLARRYFAAYNVPDASQTTPILFFGGKFLNADGVTQQSLGEAVASGAAMGTFIPEGDGQAIAQDNTLIANLQWGGVFLTGLLNGLNPCGLSMLLFLITLMGAKGFLRNGMLFVAGKFLAYFLIGTLGYHVFTAVGDFIMPGVRITVQLIMAAVAVVVAVLHIRDFFLARQEKYGRIRMQIPEGLRRAFHGMMKKLVARPAYMGVGCLLLGALISAGEFLCTGQIYIASIIYAVQNIGGARVYLFFAVYVVAAVLPALAVLLVLWRGKASFEVSETLRANMPRIRLVAGLFFLAFAAYFIVTAF